MVRPPIDQHVVFVYSDDLDRSAAFYSEILGLKQVLDQGQCRLFRVAGTAFLGVCRCREGRSVTADGVVLTFVTEDVDAWHRNLADAGVTLLGPPSHSETFGVYGFFARDPDGHLIEFQRFLDPQWPSPDSSTG